MVLLFTGRGASPGHALAGHSLRAPIRHRNFDCRGSPSRWDFFHTHTHTHALTWEIEEAGKWAPPSATFPSASSRLCFGWVVCLCVLILWPVLMLLLFALHVFHPLDIPFCFL